MKTDEIRFTTKRSLQEISNILRNGASQIKARNVEKLEDDPFGSFGQAPDIAIGMNGMNPLGFGTRGWGIEVYVTDLGNAREVQMVALGDGVRSKMSGGYFYDLSIGKSQRNKLAQMLADPAPSVSDKQGYGSSPNTGNEKQEPQRAATSSVVTASNSSSSKKTILIIAGIIIAALLVIIPLSNSSSSHYDGGEEQYTEDEYYEDDEGAGDNIDVDEESSDGYFVTGNTYYVQTNLRVREGPGKEYRILTRDELTPEDYAISVDSETTTDALIEKGKMVTCQGMSDNWMKISSGWICVYDEGEELVK